ncbi:HET-domain-containing protein [Apiospora aurea]|uniref:HET-domain-containing protein n=1 Tax=Apiospora aurea TaxID=335848 RepID=A0ABR1PTU2_9PEZI
MKLAQTSSPSWLIDTTKHCIVSGHGVQEYAALSYRWGGGTAHLQNDLSILDTLRLPGALLQTRFASRVSPTVKHAVGLTRLLGERYLWVDALCIVQNNGEQTRAQLQLMGVIYASAKLTIVATDGDANHGIPGLKGASPPRELLQPKFSLGESCQVVVRQNPDMGCHRNSSPYFKRAWAFPEYSLSKRRLVIGGNQFHWGCSSATHHEGMYGADVRSHTLNDKFRFPQIPLGKPGFDELTVPINECNSRELSFPEDALAGTSGFLSLVGRSFDGGFIYGLAVACFDSALMRTAPQLPVQRRIHSGKDHTILHGSKLPSWSWLGWKGYTFAIDEHSGELFEGSLRRPITRRITQWYMQETPTSSTKYAIRSTFLDHDGDFFKKGQSESLLKEGWTKERFDILKYISISGKDEESEENEENEGDEEDEEDEEAFHVLGDYVYKHPSLPGDHYWRPFPIKGIGGNRSNRHATIAMALPIL